MDRARNLLAIYITAALAVILTGKPARYAYYDSVLVMLRTLAVIPASRSLCPIEPSIDVRSDGLAALRGRLARSPC